MSVKTVPRANVSLQDLSAGIRRLLTGRTHAHKPGRVCGNNLSVFHCLTIHPEEGVFSGESMTKRRPTEVARQEEDNAEDVAWYRLIGSQKPQHSLC